MPAQVEARLGELRRHHPTWASAAWPTNSSAKGSTRRLGAPAATVPWSATASSSPRPVVAARPPGGVGSAAGRWSCGRWMSWVASG
jgi:hypothetical protein